MVRPTIRLRARSGASIRSIFGIEDAITITAAKDAIKKIAASQLTSGENRPGNCPTAGGAAVSRHQERGRGGWKDAVTESSISKLNYNMAFFEPETPQK
jgi:hypothetical protein